MATVKPKPRNSSLRHIQYRELVSIYRQRHEERDVAAVIKLVESRQGQPLTEHGKVEVEKEYKKIQTYFCKAYTASQRKYERVEQNFGNWLNKDLVIPIGFFLSRTVGRPKKLLAECSTRQRNNRKRTEVDQLVGHMENCSVSTVVKATSELLQEKGEQGIAEILKKLQTPRRAAKLMESLNKPVNGVIPYLPEEALALLLDKGFTVQTYKDLRLEALRRGVNLYPSYELVSEAKKKCRPLQIPAINEACVSVTLDSLLCHTAARIVQTQELVLDEFFNAAKLIAADCFLEFSWGFDGSTGQSEYKQRSNATNLDDSSLVATTVIPLRLKTSNGNVLWLNPTPQSVSTCRPLRIQFAKESPGFILKEQERVEEEINQLETVTITTAAGNKLFITFQLYLTIIDGKVWSVINGQSSFQVCPICNATPKDMNKIETIQSTNEVNVSALKNGISPLHCWIRFLEFVLHLSYRNVKGLKIWRVTAGKKVILLKRKELIQRKLQEELGLRVDFPKSGGSGTSNDGNTARRFFSEQDRSTVSSILGIEEWLLRDLHVVLCAISSTYPVNSERFGDFAEDLARRIVQSYSWYYLPVSVHKVLVHGRLIINSSALPVGSLSEQAGESRNKYYRQFREFHARRTSREHNLLDLFNRSMDTSDPVLSEFRLHQRLKRIKRCKLPEKVLELLDGCDAEGILPLDYSEDSVYDLVEVMDVELPNEIPNDSEQIQDTSLLEVWSATV